MPSRILNPQWPGARIVCSETPIVAWMQYLPWECQYQSYPSIVGACPTCSINSFNGSSIVTVWIVFVIFFKNLIDRWHISSRSGKALPFQIWDWVSIDVKPHFYESGNVEFIPNYIDTPINSLSNRYSINGVQKETPLFKASHSRSPL